MLKKYRELLQKLPLGDEAAKVGIYGKGGHTEGLLSAYNTLIGNVCSQIVFLKTLISDDDGNEDTVYPTKSYLAIDDTYDLVIISSFIYQADMKKMC